ncbi:MAG: hypothetical protein ACYTAO_11380 [Planctomycetota bacterium]|jgi:hypothetical protein
MAKKTGDKQVDEMADQVKVLVEASEQEAAQEAAAKAAAEAEDEQAGTPDEKEPVEETPAVDEEVSEEPGEPEEEKEEEEEPESWITDDVLDFAESAGLTREDMEEFGSQEELERTVRLWDRRHISGAQAQSQVQPQRAPAQPQQQQPAAKPELPPLDSELFEEHQIKAFQARDEYHRKRYDELSQVLGQTLAHLQQQEMQQEIQRFHEVLGDLGQEKLFGKDGQISGTQARNRDRVLQAYAWLPNRAPTKAMLRRAVNSEFSSELRKSDQDRFRKSARKQSKKVLRGGGRKARTIPKEEEPAGGGFTDSDEQTAVDIYKKVVAKG